MTASPITASAEGAPSDARAGERAFLAAMSQVASPVSVVTTLTADGPHGTTVSAFASLSLDPPMVLLSLDRRSSLLAKLTVGRPVGVNVLAAHQDQVALRFAGSHPDKFADIAWRLEQGAPALADRHAWLSGRVDRLVEAGDHTIVLVAVGHSEVGGQAPLVYWQRTFGTHQAF